MAWSSVLYALLFFLPAYVANMSPLLVAKVIPGWNAPIDGGRLAKDGKRLLGKGKTWRGLAGGTVLGAITAVVVAWLVPPFHEPGFFSGWDYAYGGFAGAPIGSEGSPPPSCADLCGVSSTSSPLWAIVLYGAILGFAALVGDAVKSYFKRRLGKEGGAPWVPFDQLDFVLFGLAAAFAAAPLLADGWVHAALLDDWVVLTTLVVLTPLLHFLVNVIGYWLKLKDVPW